MQDAYVSETIKSFIKENKVNIIDQLFHDSENENCIQCGEEYFELTFF